LENVLQLVGVSRKRASEGVHDRYRLWRRGPRLFWQSRGQSPEKWANRVSDPRVSNVGQYAPPNPTGDGEQSLPRRVVALREESKVSREVVGRYAARTLPYLRRWNPDRFSTQRPKSKVEVGLLHVDEKVFTDPCSADVGPAIEQEGSVEPISRKR
jgi:hypothetical protein